MSKFINLLLFNRAVVKKRHIIMENYDLCFVNIIIMCYKYIILLYKLISEWDVKIAITFNKLVLFWNIILPKTYWPEHNALCESWMLD